MNKRLFDFRFDRGMMGVANGGFYARIEYRRPGLALSSFVPPSTDRVSFRYAVEFRLVYDHGDRSSYNGLSKTKWLPSFLMRRDIAMPLAGRDIAPNLGVGRRFRADVGRRASLCSRVMTPNAARSCLPFFARATRHTVTHRAIIAAALTRTPAARQQHFAHGSVYRFTTSIKLIIPAACLAAPF